MPTRYTHVSFVDGRAADQPIHRPIWTGRDFTRQQISVEARMDLIFLFVSTIREEARGVPISHRPITARCLEITIWALSLTLKIDRHTN